MMPEKNIQDLHFDRNGGLYSATDKRGRVVQVFMYNPKTDTLLAGNEMHGELHGKYGGGRFDDFVKAVYQGPGYPAPGEQLAIFTDRHDATSTAQAWNMAFDAAKALRDAGFPGSTHLAIGEEGAIMSGWAEEGYSTLLLEEA